MKLKPINFVKVCTVTEKFDMKGRNVTLLNNQKLGGDGYGERGNILDGNKGDEVRSAESVDVCTMAKNGIIVFVAMPYGGDSLP